MTLQEKNDNEDNDQENKSGMSYGECGPSAQNLPEQEAGNITGKGIQQEEQQGGQKQVTGIHLNFYSGISVETTLTTFRPPRQR